MSEPLWKVYEGMLTETREKLSAETKLREKAEAALAVLAANPHTLCDEHIARLTALGREANTALAAAEARATRAEGALRELNDALHWNVDPKRGMIGAWFRYRTPYVRLHAKVARALAGEAQKATAP
jgi:hypothetical protein